MASAIDFGDLDAITSSARKDLVGQTGAAPAPAAGAGLGFGPALGVGLATSSAQGLLGWYTWKKEQEAKKEAQRIQQEQFNQQMALQNRGQDFRESSYRNESPLRTAQAASGLNNVAGQNLKYLDLIRGLRGVGV